MSELSQNSTSLFSGGHINFRGPAIGEQDLNSLEAIVLKRKRSNARVREMSEEELRAHKKKALEHAEREKANRVTNPATNFLSKTV
jgi:hypothetical protein